MRKKTRILLLSAILLYLAFPLTQIFIAHRAGWSPTKSILPMELAPYFQSESLTLSDYRILHQQTGLGKIPIDLLKSAGTEGYLQLLTHQKNHLKPRQESCHSMLGRFTCEDRVGEKNDAFSSWAVMPQAGDILITLSTHTMGWRHGHGGIVVRTDEGLGVLESEVLGSNSKIIPLEHWKNYSSFALLRVKGISEQEGEEIAHLAITHMLDKPYRLTAGLLGDKLISPTSDFLGGHCFYLVWYPFMLAGYDLDSDQGRIVTGHDLLNSDRLQIIHSYGMVAGQCH